MSLESFISFYRQRNQFFEQWYDNKLLKKAYIKLRKGSEIRIDDITRFQSDIQSTMNDIFIDVPQVELVKSTVQSALDDVAVTMETDIRIVYGDYGHGKSQTAHLLVEELQASNNHKQILHLENISSFRRFFTNISNTAQNHLSDKYPDLLPATASHLSICGKATSDDSISAAALSSSFVDYLRATAEQEVVHVLIFDELDKIISDDVERKQWIDFFVTLTDESDLGVLLVCLFPQNVSKSLIAYDRRMERWNNFFNLNATILDGRYGSAVRDGVANIMALADQYHSQLFDEQTLEYINHILAYKNSYLTSASIRQVNTWSILLYELLYKITQYNVWDLHKVLHNERQHLLPSYYEERMHLLLQDDTLPTFDMRVDESDQPETYRVKYEKSPIEFGEVQSDGHYKLYVSYNDRETLKDQIAVVIRVVEDSEVDFYVKPLTKLSEKYPTVFISLGLTADKSLEFRDTIRDLNRSEPHNYPLEALNIPQNLLSPLAILLEAEGAPGYPQKIQLLVNWAIVVTGHRDELMHILQELPAQLVIRELMLRGLQLANVSPDQFRATSGRHEERPQHDLKQAKTVLFATLVSSIDEIGTYKLLTTIERNVTKVIEKQFPSLADELLSDLSLVINTLYQADLIDKGGETRVTIKKTINWDEKKAFDELKRLLN